jgi:hypothetical protein
MKGLFVLLVIVVAGLNATSLRNFEDHGLINKFRNSGMFQVNRVARKAFPDPQTP